jgi:NAD(P)-dependent dehydrogenase (short-subunit alcohol dehydrogenase family)
MSFEGQVAVVTGAGRGLGRAYALDLARRGCAVVVNDVGGLSGPDGPWAEAVVSEIREIGGQATTSLDSVATEEGGRAIVETATSVFGRLDVLICNAGFLRPAMFGDMTADQIREVLDVHLLGAFNVAQPAWGAMSGQQYGRIVLTSSSAIFGNESCANYTAAKAGLLGLGRALAVEGSSLGIKTNCVLPYAVSQITVDQPLLGSDTSGNQAAQQELAPRRGTESVSPLVTYLSSRRCRVNGQAFSALAGRYARVFLAVSPGWLADDPRLVDAEQIGEQIDAIMDVSGSMVPETMGDEIQSVLSAVRALAG